LNQIYNMYATFIILRSKDGLTS